MAAAKSTPAAGDPRHPDTGVDKGRATPALEPGDFGFTTIDEVEPAEGQGAIPPTVVEPVSSVPNSTFASRAGLSFPGAENKAVQDAEIK